MAGGKLWNYEKILNMNVYEVHTHLAHKLDKQELKTTLRMGKNAIKL